MEIVSTALLCLALTIYKEARGEPERGQVAVGLVVLNRVKQTNKNACQVITAPAQFSWYEGTSSLLIPTWDTSTWKKSISAAKTALFVHQYDISGINHFHHKSMTPKWASSLVPHEVIGNHVFYSSFRTKKGG